MLRLRDCLLNKLILPARAYGVRHLLDQAASRMGRTLEAAVETRSFELIRHYVTNEDAIGFQIPIGLNMKTMARTTHRPLSARDVKSGRLLLGQMKGRALPVASAKFAQQLAQALASYAE